jgi:signal transduction histidine kinase
MDPPSLDLTEHDGDLRLDDVVDVRAVLDSVEMLAHDVRTTVTVVAGTAEYLLTQGSRISARDREVWLRRLISNADELARRIANVSTLGRGPARADASRTDVQSCATAVVDRLAVLVGDRTVRYAFAEEVAVAASTEAVDRILENLLTNAVKYSPDDSTITISAFGNESTVTVTVEDEGVGLTKYDRGRVFERHYRGGATPGDGTGLGLAIVSDLVTECGGRVWVQSSPGQGCNFAFELPAA